jgi:ABC-type branched-subunit amino acid transport system ATPase component/predicted MFS family arabinose efflux permease
VSTGTGVGPQRPDSPQSPYRQFHPVRDALAVLRAAADWRAIARTPYGARPLVVLSALGFFVGFLGQAFNIAAPNIVQDTRIDIQQIVGLLATIGFIQLFANVALGWWFDRHRRAPWVGTFGAISAGLNGLASRATNFSSLSAAIVGSGVAGVIGDVPSSSLAADYYPVEARGRVGAISQTTGGISAIAATVGAAVVVQAYGWRSALVFFSIPAVIVALIAIPLLKEPIRGYFERRYAGVDDEAARIEEQPLSLGEGWRATFAVRTVRRIFLSDMFTGIGVVGYTAFFPFFLADQYGLDAFQRGLFTLPVVVSSLLGAYIGGGLLDYFSAKAPAQILRMGGFLALAGVVGVLALGFALPLPLIIVGSSLITFANSLFAPIRFTINTQIVPPVVRTQGLQIQGIAAAPGAIGLFVFGVIFATYGYSAVFFVSVPFLLIGAAIYITAADFFETDRRSMAAATAASEAYRELELTERKKLLVCRGVDVEYDGTQVLFGVDFDVEEGEILALLGTNGAGKSTLLKAISGTQEASGGSIVFLGRDITHMPPHETAARGIVHMPGGRGTFPNLTVRENLMLATWLLDSRTEADAALQRVYQLFPVLQVRGGELAAALSGGEQQMLSLSQAFLAKPKVLMIDELSLGLSPQVVGQLLEIVREIHSRGTTIIVVEQSVNVALNLANRAIFMEKGEVKFVGRTADLLTRPDILRAVYVKGTGTLGGAVVSESDRARREAELDAVGSVLKVESIVKSYGGVLALRDVSLNLRQGEVLGLIGPNGSGKTTLFDVISGYQKPDSGRVIYEGVDVTAMPPHERARRKLVRRFQDARLFPTMTVSEALLVALDQRIEVRNPALSALGVPQARRAEKRARARADLLIDLLDLGSYRDKFVRELSTGLRRIVDLAFVLAAEPKVLLLDEPSSGIAQAEAEGLAPLLRRVRFETGCSILIIEHDMSLLAAVSDELIALDQGQVVLRGTAEEVLNDNLVIEAYLGGAEAAIKRSGVM